MIPDRDKVVLLVVEMKENDIKFWYKIDNEVREILNESELADRGVCIRYYKFWTERVIEEQRESQEAARIREREEAAQADHEDLDEPDDEAEDSGLPLPPMRTDPLQLMRTENRRRPAIPIPAGPRPALRQSLIPGERRSQLEDRTNEMLGISPRPAWAGESSNTLPPFNFQFNTTRVPRRNAPELTRSGRGRRNLESIGRPSRSRFNEN